MRHAARVIFACSVCFTGACAAAGKPPPPASTEKVDARATIGERADVAVTIEPLEAAPEEEPTWPQEPPAKRMIAPIAPDLAPICAGASSLPKEKPHTAACCYPAKELLTRPLRAAFPSLHACYTKSSAANVADVRVTFSFRIEQDGSIQRVCSARGTTLGDEAAVRCMLAELLKMSYPARTDDDVRFCGLITMSYPVMFQ